ARDVSAREAVSRSSLAGLVGIFAAGMIALWFAPTFLGAVQRGKQKRTMADMRSIDRCLGRLWAKDGSWPAFAELACLRPAGPDHPCSTDGWKNCIHFTTRG